MSKLKSLLITPISFKKYIIRILLLNFLGLAFLSDSISFDQGIFSLQGLIYSLNKFIFLIFILIETTSVYLQEYELNYDFLKLIIRDFFSLNFKYSFFVLFEKYRYLIFFFTLFFYVSYFEKKLIEKLTINLNFFIKLLVSIFTLLTIVVFTQIERLDLYFNKIKNYDDLFIKYNILRNDNWYLQSINYLNYEKKKNDLIFENIKFENIIDKKADNIYIIINESYPLFKNQEINEKIFYPLSDSNLKIEKFKKNWNKSYSTQGSEVELFCNSDKFFERFKNDFINLINEKCWINNLKNKNSVFIHTYEKTFFDRGRYDKFFSKTFFLKDLKKLNYQMCPGMYKGICDYEVLNNLEKFLDKDNNFLIFLTLQNHHPTKLYPVIKKKDLSACKDFYPLNILDQFCYLYLNQTYFNQLIYENIIKKMSKNDIFIMISDTPPAFPKKWKIFFEDYVEVIKITK